MNYFERMLLSYLSRGKIKMEITGFDQAGFEKAIRNTLKHRLDTIESIVFEDSGVISDAQKVAYIQNLFQQEFNNKD